MRARFLIPVGLILGLAMLGPPAAAETRPPPGPSGGAYIDSGGDPTATARDGTAVPAGGGERGGDGGSPPCHWEVAIADDFEFNIYSADTLEAQHSETGRWLQYVCDGIGAVEVGGFLLIPEGGLVDPAALATDALSSVGIEPPAIRTSPSAEGRLYVQIPTWLWLAESWWHTYKATASAGRVISTVSARPASTTWTLGDGGSVTCPGAGRPWQPGLAEDATECRHIYYGSSAGRPGGTFQIEAAVTLEVTWSSNIGAGGTLPAISRTATLDVEVGEIQAIGTD